jgi:hypothetical protein
MSTDRKGLAFYTCFYGSDYNWAFVIPPIPCDEYDSFYFTNNKKMFDLLKSTKWIPVWSDIPIYNDNIKDCMSTKELRACPHRFSQLDQYKYVCWFDSKLKVDIDRINSIIKTMDAANKSIVLSKHPFQFDTVWGEYELAIKYDKYAAQKDAYKTYIQTKLDAGYSEKLEVHYCGGFSIRDLSNPHVLRYNEEWLSNIRGCGIEDQISLQFVHPIYKEIILPIEYKSCWNYV